MTRSTERPHATMAARKRIALVAHDNKKDDLLEWVSFNLAKLAEHDFYATGTTGALLADKRDVRRQASAWVDKGGSYVDVLDRVSSPLTTPSRAAARSEAVAVLMVRMLQLPEDYRQVIRWRLIDGLEVAEVARRLNRSEAAVHMLCHRALRQLRELMGTASDYLTQT